MGTFDVFFRGVGFGIFLMLLVESVIIYCLIIHFTTPKVRNHAEVEFQPNDTQTTTEIFKRHSNEDYLNLFLIRMFLCLMNSKEFKSRWTLKISTKLNMKLKENSFIDSIKILDLDLGDHPPKIIATRIKKLSDLSIITEVDIQYQGGSSIKAEVMLTNGNCIPVSIVMNELQGTLLCRFPSLRWEDMLGIQFIKDPGISFHVNTPLTLGDNETLRGVINKVLCADNSYYQLCCGKYFWTCALHQRGEQYICL